MCFIFHKWAKWEEYERPIIYFYHGILLSPELQGKEFETIEHRQKRACKRCGQTQDELIFVD